MLGTSGGKRNLSKETEDDQMGISELKNIKTEIKTKKLKRWVQQPVEKRKESVNWKTEYIGESEQNGKKCHEKNEQSLWDLWDHNKRSNI